MKKLALALVCLVSVAFFASCTKPVENPEPSIAILAAEGYVQNYDVVDMNTEVNFGFVVSSNPETQKALKSLVVYIDDTQWANITDSINGLTEYTYKDVVIYTPSKDDVTSVITATVTDVDGKTATATINLTINSAMPLIARTFEWYRLGNNITGLDEFGLEWKGNYPKDVYAKIVPQDGVKLFVFQSADWEKATTDVEKAALFNNAIETMEPADEYWNVNVTVQDKTYDDVIGTVKADGTCYLIHVTNSHSVSLAAGTETTITGEVK